MRLIETFTSNPDRWDYRQGPWRLELIDSENETSTSISFSEGEPEDMSFNRDLSDVFNISNIVKAAYEAGRRGEELHYEYIEIKEDE